MDKLWIPLFFKPFVFKLFVFYTHRHISIVGWDWCSFTYLKMCQQTFIWNLINLTFSKSPSIDGTLFWFHRIVFKPFCIQASYFLRLFRNKSFCWIFLLNLLNGLIAFLFWSVTYLYYFRSWWFRIWSSRLSRSTSSRLESSSEVVISLVNKEQWRIGAKKRIEIFFCVFFSTFFKISIFCVMALQMQLNR